MHRWHVLYRFQMSPVWFGDTELAVVEPNLLPHRRERHSLHVSSHLRCLDPMLWGGSR